MPIRGVKYNPKTVTHPGCTLSEELHGRDISPNDFAKQIGVDSDIILEIILEERAITPDLAEAFDKALGLPAHFWMNRQRQHDESASKKIIRGKKYISTIKFHPGSTLSEKLQELDLSPKDFAEQINVDADIIVDIILEERDVTPDLAEAFERAIKIPAAFWLRKQKNYNQFLTRQEATETP